MKPRKQKTEEPEREERHPADEQTEDVVRDGERLPKPGDEDIDDEDIDDESVGRPVTIER